MPIELLFAPLASAPTREMAEAASRQSLEHWIMFGFVAAVVVIALLLLVRAGNRKQRVTFERTGSVIVSQPWDQSSDSQTP
jgi:hypothetical protein